jgi:excisionase family DNA binding protein
MNEPVNKLAGVDEVQSVNAEQAASLLGIGLRTVRRLLANGKLAFYRTGRRVCIRLADLRTFQEQNKQGGCA